jgi:spore coat protein U-like protein
MKQKNALSRRVLSLITASVMALGSTGFSGSVAAGTATGDIAVSAVVSANCSISAGAVTFGAYDPVVANKSSALDGTGTVTVDCTSGASTTVTLGQGLNADTGSTDAAPVRRLRNGTNHLSYSLYSDSGRTTVWGNTTPTGLPYTGTGSGVALTIYGTIPANQQVPAATYNDTVVATVTF